MPSEFVLPKHFLDSPHLEPVYDVLRQNLPITWLPAPRSPILEGYHQWLRSIASDSYATAILERYQRQQTSPSNIRSANEPASALSPIIDCANDLPPTLEAQQLDPIAYYHMIQADYERSVLQSIPVIQADNRSDADWRNEVHHAECARIASESTTAQNMLDTLNKALNTWPKSQTLQNWQRIYTNALAAYQNEQL
jgi:hypothetical protein